MSGVSTVGVLLRTRSPVVRPSIVAALLLSIILACVTNDADAEAKIGAVSANAEGFRSSTRVFADCVIRPNGTDAELGTDVRQCLKRLEGVATKDGATKTSGKWFYHTRLVFPVDFVRSAPAPTCASVPKPLDDTNTATCPAGTVGTFGQTRAYVSDPRQVHPDQCWMKGADDDWLPKTSEQCLPADSDGDGVPDSADKCPNVNAATPDGCPAPEPVNCAVSAWNAWTPATCSAPAQQTRTRTILTQPAHGGAACPALTESRTCQPATTLPALQLSNAKTGPYRPLDGATLTGGINIRFPTPCTTLGLWVFYIDGRQIRTDQTCPLTMFGDSVVYDSKLLTNGAHVIEARIHNTTQVVRANVTVANGTIPNPPPPPDSDPTPTTGDVVLTWGRPTQNVDDSPLTNLSGYRIVYGNKPDELFKSIEITNADTTRYVVEDLAAGTWYFAVISVAGLNQSAPSGVASKVVQ